MKTKRTLKEILEVQRRSHKKVSFLNVLIKNRPEDNDENWKDVACCLYSVII